MKFKVREGFVFRRVDLVDDGTGKKVEQEKIAYQNQVIDLTKAQAKQHLHQLEPEDAEARKFCEQSFVPAPTVPEGGFTPEKVQELIDMAVRAALAAVKATQADPKAAPAAG